MRRSRIGEVQDRFWLRVDKSGGADACWNWTGTVSDTAGGYGVIGGKIHGKRHVKAGQNMLTHRVAWLLEHGDIPSGAGYHGTVVMHSCDNRLCVNPRHLRVGTQSENVKDMDDKARANRSGILPKSGVKHANASFDELALLYIRNSTLGTVALAKKMNVHRSTIRRARDWHTYV